MNDFFNTLGIEATKEEKEIKKAYREKLHTVNPEKVLEVPFDYL